MKDILQDNPSEILPTVDENGNVTGHATRAACHDGSKLLHPVVHLHVFNSRGELYLQKRPEWKSIQPGKWDTATGGHVNYGEDIRTALEREVLEELGMEGFEYSHICSYVFESEVEKELVHVFRTTYDGPVNPSQELDGGRFWSIGEITGSVGKGILTPNLEGELHMILGEDTACTRQ